MDERKWWDIDAKQSVKLLLERTLSDVSTWWFALSMERGWVR